MLGSDLFSHASAGHYMAQYAQFVSNEASSVEAETNRVLTEMHDTKAPAVQQETARPVEQSSNPNESSLQQRSKDPTQKVGPDGKAYTPEEKKEIEELEDRDAEVKRHERAHFQAAGKYANPPKYEYQTGPDGKRYAVGGSVDIDMSEIPDDPQATLEKARVIKRAALAPEEPSAQDRKVAREADQMATHAQRQITEQQSGQVEHAVAGMPESKEAPKMPEESVTPEEVTQVATESFEMDPAQNFAFDMVPRYRTSRLQMSEGLVSKTAKLFMPRQTYFRGQGLSFDSYI